MQVSAKTLPDLRKDFIRVAAERLSVPVGRPIDFGEMASSFASLGAHVRSVEDHIHVLLANYSTYPAVRDEIARTIDLLDHIEENKGYFQYRIGCAAGFMPRNQLLYATIYMGVALSPLCEAVCLRAPSAGAQCVEQLWQLLELPLRMSNLRLFSGSRRAFVAKYASRSDVVVFTGNPENAATVRKSVRKDALFILNGAGHNPVVLGDNANIESAAAAISELCFYNQGQDCSAPNTVLVPESQTGRVVDALVGRCRAAERAIKLGYHPDNAIGPNTDRPHLLALCKRFLSLRRWHMFGGAINVADGIVSPTLFVKPVTNGVELKEFYAPVVMIQPYSTAKELRRLFYQRNYLSNAMYLTVFGQIPLLDELARAGIHPPNTIIIDSNLFREERGVLPYGGYGPDASCLFIGGQMLPSPVLLQREIFELCVKPHLTDGVASRVDDSGKEGVNRRGLSRREHHLNSIRQLGQNVYSNEFAVSASCREVRQRFQRHEKEVGERERVAGRISAIRYGGRYIDIDDGSASLQLHFRDARSRSTPGIWSYLDKGDIVGCSGEIVRTKSRYITMEVDECVLLSKALVNSSDASEWNITQSEMISSWRRVLHAEGFREVWVGGETFSAGVAVHVPHQNEICSIDDLVVAGALRSQMPPWRTGMRLFEIESGNAGDAASPYVAVYLRHTDSNETLLLFEKLLRRVTSTFETHPNQFPTSVSAGARSLPDVKALELAIGLVQGYEVGRCYTIGRTPTIVAEMRDDDALDVKEACRDEWERHALRGVFPVNVMVVSGNEMVKAIAMDVTQKTFPSAPGPAHP